MQLKTKQAVIGGLGFTFLLSLVFVQYMEVTRKRAELGLSEAHAVIPASSQACVSCHEQSNKGIVDHWKGSTHALKGVGCAECHEAQKGEPDAFEHYGKIIATVVTPLDCSRCHPREFDEFAHSHHAKAGNILASLDNFLAEAVEGSRLPMNPHGPTPGLGMVEVNGNASVIVGCRQCHGGKVGLVSTDGGMITMDDLKPDAKGKPTIVEAMAKIKLDANGKPSYHSDTWPNTGIGRINLDGSLGSCSACHSRHDFSPRRARQPENCGKCHLGPDHPQKEIYDESKHGVAFRDLREKMNLDAKTWILGKDYSQAPTCATCHMSGNMLNGGKTTHDPGERISWTNRPPVSLVMDTDKDHKVVVEADPEKRAALIADTAADKRNRMKQVCSHCHSPDYVNGFYEQYDDFVVLYNEKFGKPGSAIMKAMLDAKVITATQFDEEVEWTWYYLWHHEGRRARHGASMMAPDYAHWHGMFEVADRWYVHFIPQVREAIHKAEAAGNSEGAKAALAVVDEIMARPEHQWQKPAAEQAAAK